MKKQVKFEKKQFSNITELLSWISEGKPCLAFGNIYKDMRRAAIEDVFRAWIKKDIYKLVPVAPKKMTMEEEIKYLRTTLKAAFLIIGKTDLVSQNPELRSIREQFISRLDKVGLL